MNGIMMAISYIFVFCYALVLLILLEINMIWKRGNAARSIDIKWFYTSKQLMMCCVFSKPGHTLLSEYVILCLKVRELMNKWFPFLWFVYCRPSPIQCFIFHEYTISSCRSGCVFISWFGNNWWKAYDW
jgi:hypothetical protein